MSTDKAEECFVYPMTSPQHGRQRGHRSACLCVFFSVYLWLGAAAVFAPASFRPSFGDIIYQMGLLPAETAGLQTHQVLCLALFFVRRSVFVRVHSPSPQLNAAGYRQQTYDLLVCVSLSVCVHAYLFQLCSSKHGLGFPWTLSCTFLDIFLVYFCILKDFFGTFFNILYCIAYIIYIVYNILYVLLC